MGFAEWFRVDLDFGVASGGGASQKHASVDGNRFYAQIGNAVCPPVVTALAEPLLKEMRIVGQEATSDFLKHMEVDCHNSKRKREVERHACSTRPACACAKVFVLQQ